MSAPVWVCDHCSQPITDGQGWLICDAVEALHRPVAWGVYCADHTPDGNEGDYDLPIGFLDDWEKVAHWLEHLGGKTWFANTIWPNPVKAEGAAV